MINTCKFCIYLFIRMKRTNPFSENPDLEYPQYECHKYAPDREVRSGMIYGPTAHETSVWPVLSLDVGCGEFKEKA